MVRDSVSKTFSLVQLKINLFTIPPKLLMKVIMRYTFDNQLTFEGIVYKEINF